jgi:pimeloyl-ACP methyl ester carboxylesterase
MKPVYLGSVAGVLHPPLGPPTGLGVLLVPPFGWDDQSFYRPRRAWAQALARDGHVALRIDLPGTGDSAGGPRDADLLAAWVDAIRAGVAALGTPRTALIGLGLGGLISLPVAVDDLILWGVPGRGRAALRELKAFGRLEAAQTGEEPGDGPELRAGGHVMCEATAAAISALDVSSLAVPRRALVLGRDGVEPDAALCAALREGGAEVESDAGDGWGAALAGPQYAVVPTAAIERCAAFLTHRDGGAAAPGPAAETLQLPGVRETPLSFDGGRFGILAEPDGAPARDLTAVLLNAGAVRHIGPNRMWVETARRWAAQGVPTLRLDLEGIGEADGPDEPYGDDAKFYIPELTEQVRPVLDALAARGLPGRFLIAGLCSGGYWALHTAATDERIRSVVLLNPRLLFWDAEASSRRELRRALSVLTPSGFRALRRADRPLSRLRELARWIVARPFRRPTPAASGGSPIRDVVSRLQRHGQRLEFAFSGNEPLQDELRRSGDAEWLTARGVPIHPLPYRSHTLKPIGAQAATHAILDAALERARAQ